MAGTAGDKRLILAPTGPAEYRRVAAGRVVHWPCAGRTGNVQPFVACAAYTIAVPDLPLPMKPALPSVLALLLAGPVMAQSPGEETRNRVVIVENVKFDYAQVLNVEPVFQVLRATRTEEHCEPVSTRTLAPVNVTGEEPVEEKGRFGRLWESVRSIFKSGEGEGEYIPAHPVAAESPASGNGPMLTRDCRIVPVGREFRRPIAYDVDYVYKGTKYRSRLPDDPGNRLKIRVSITPWVGAEAEGAATATP